jgi:HD-GYP domain-containing protein (c-di-GMP phosphodiesterase class II)
MELDVVSQELEADFLAFPEELEADLPELEEEEPYFHDSLEAELPFEESLEMELPLETAHPQHVPFSAYPPSNTDIQTHDDLPAITDTPTNESLDSVDMFSLEAEPFASDELSQEAEVTKLLQSESFLRESEKKQIQLDPTEEKHQLAKEILLGLARVLSSFQLYHARNQAVKDALAELYSRLTLFFQAHDALPLVVKPWQFEYDNQLIYKNVDPESSLSFKLYRDGVRALVLQKGINASEIARLIALIVASQSQFNQSEDDIVTLFWQADFQHAELIAVEGLKSRNDEQAERPVDALFARLLDDKKENQHTAPTTSSKTLQQHDIDTIFESWTQQESPHLWLDAPHDTPFSHHPPHHEQLLQLKEQLDQQHTPERMESVLQHLLTILPYLTTKPEQKGLKSWLSSYVAYLFREGNTTAFGRLMGFAGQWVQMSSPGDLLNQLAHIVIGSLTDTASLKHLLMGLQLPPDEPVPPLLYELFTRFPQDCTTPMFTLLGEPLENKQQQTLRKLLLALCNQQEAPFLERLQQASPTESVQLLYCLRDLGTPAAINAIADQIHHPDPTIQDAVLSMAELLAGSGQRASQLRKIVDTLLRSQDPVERNRAYTLMRSSNDPRWANMLLKAFQERQELDLDERTEVGQLAATLHPDAAFPILQQLASPPSRIAIERTLRKEQRFAAIASLPIIGGLKVEESVRKMVKSSSGDIKDAYIQAMRDIRRGSAQPTPRTTTQTPPTFADTNQSESNAPTTQPTNAQRTLEEEFASLLDHITFDREDKQDNQLRTLGSRFVALFQTLGKNASLYDANNAIFERPINEMLTLQEALYEETPEFSMIGLEEQFYINDLRINMQGANTKQVCADLCREFQHMKVGGFLFKHTMDGTQWRTFMQAYAGNTPSGKATSPGQMQQLLQEHKLDDCVEVIAEMAYQVGDETDQRNNVYYLCARSLEVGEEAWQRAHQALPPNPLPIRRFMNNWVDFYWRNPAERMPSLAFEAPDNPLLSHSLNVALLAIRVGQALQLPRTTLTDLGMSGLYHDTGHAHAIGRADSGHKGATHQQSGVAMFLQQGSFQPAKLQRLVSLLEHHRDFQSESSAPPAIFSRILRACDVYDTITNRQLMDGMPLPPSEAIKILTHPEQRAFDPVVASMLTHVLGEFPIGACVELNDATIGLSLGTDTTPEHISRPDILVLKAGRAGVPAKQVLSLRQPEYEALKVLRLRPPPKGKTAKLILTQYFRFLHRQNEAKTKKK